MPKILTKKILHLTPHLGGGVGKVLLNYLAKTKNRSAFIHQVACLDYANAAAQKAMKLVGLEFFDRLTNQLSRLLKMIREADLVLIHWWNHPLLYDFLVRTPLPPCRLIMWSHTAGFHPPYVFTRKVLLYPDLFVLATPISLETKEIKNLSEQQKKSLRLVWSSGGIEQTVLVKPRKHAGFNIGYLGTVDYAKLHPNFLKICAKINIPEAKFVVCGGPSEGAIKKEAAKLGLADKFQFTGPVSDVAAYFSTFDIFGYPLASYHYGSCDQVLAESMAAGVVPVVLANRMEKYMVQNGVTGLVAKNENDYIQAVRKLYTDKALRKTLLLKARKYAAKTFSLDKMIQDWGKVFEETLALPKTPKIWETSSKSEQVSAASVFLESLGDYGQSFSGYYRAKSAEDRNKAEKKIIQLAANSVIWKAETRGTAHHYHSFFPRDEYLAFWSKITR